jgi:hypothetical protein
MVPLLCDRSEKSPLDKSGRKFGRPALTRRLLCGAVGKGIRRIARDLGVSARCFGETGFLG